MKKIIALLISTLFASAAFAAAPAIDKSVAQADSESLVNTKGQDNSMDEDKAADETPLAADAVGTQDADD